MSKPEMYTDQEITEGFEQSLKDGTVTDVMGNPLTEEDFIAVSKETSPWDTLEIIKTFQGKILTILDATFEDKERVKYVKDIVKGEFARLGDRIIDINQDLTNCSQSNPLK